MIYVLDTMASNIKLFLGLMAVLNIDKVLMRPNAFVSIHISSHTIRDSVARVQQIMEHRDSILKSTFVSIAKVHLTLLVVNLHNEEEEKRAVDILCGAAHSISQHVLGSRRIDMKGVGNFSDKVVYFRILQDRLLEDMAAIVRHDFKLGGFPSEDSRNFTAHLSIARVRRRSMVNSIPSYTYANLNDTYFGSDVVTGLELLSMDKPTGKDGYYYRYGQCFFK